jgi:phage gpG-like protein
VTIKMHASLDDLGLKNRFRHLKLVSRPEVLLRTVRGGGLQLIGYIKVNINNRGLIDTGNLINSVMEDEFYAGQKNAWVTVGPHVVYAAIHEFGGVIRPTNGPYLVFQTKDGVWHATTSVTIPARPYVRPAIDEHTPDIVYAMGVVMKGEIEKAWANNGG